MATVLLKFDTIQEILNYVEAECPKKRKSNHSRDDMGWFCPPSWEQVLKWAKGAEIFKPENVAYGHEVVQKVRSLDAGVNPNVLDSTFEIVGDEFDMFRYMDGYHDCMKTYEPPVAKRCLNIVIHIGALCDIYAETLENRGAAVLGLLQALQDTGKFIIKARIVFFNSDYNGDQFCSFLEMDFSKIWSRQLINFMVGSVGMFRRLGFATLEAYYNRPHCHGYGYTNSIKEVIDGLKGDRKHEMVRLFGEEGENLIVFDNTTSNHTKEEIMKNTLKVVERVSKGEKTVYCRV